MKKITVTIGIPAYNEEGNISSLLKEIFAQQQTDISITQVIVSSDASTDNTNKIVNSYKKVKLLIHKRRKGLAAMQNAILKEATGDYVILLNADTKLGNNKLINTLCTYAEKHTIDLCSIRFKELMPRSRMESILYTSMQLKTNIFENYKNGKNVFTCHGQLRCLSKKFYSSLSFPINIGEDAYSYFYCITRNFAYGYNKNLCAYYKLPENIQDHESQSVRFHQSQTLLTKHFNKELLQREYSLPKLLVIKYILQTFFKSPFLVTVYIFVTIYMKIISMIKVNAADIWTTATSSKSLSYE